MFIEILRVIYTLLKEYFTAIVAFIGGIFSPIMPYFNYIHTKIHSIVAMISPSNMNLNYEELFVTLITVFLSAIAAGLGAFTIQTISKIFHQHIFLRVFPKLKTKYKE